LASSQSELFASPRARNLAANEGLPLAGVPGTGPGGRVIERDVRAALEGRAPLTLAAKALRQAQGDAPAIGAGLGGRVTAADMTSAKALSEESEASKPKQPLTSYLLPLTSETFPGPVTDTVVKGVRKIISDRMSASLSAMAQLTLNSSADATRIQAMRARFKSADESLGLNKITVNDLVLFAVSRTLPRFPYMNAHKLSGQGGDFVRAYERVHLGVAVDTPRGLMVPVLRNADLLSLAQISAEAKRLAKAAQDGSIKPDELSGSTFTVTNLGSLDVESFTPIINAPEVGILGVCNIVQRPMPADEDECCGVTFQPRLGLSLTFNHQVVDGAPAARFLKALGGAIADIDLYLSL
jgi:pyruvate dehydrogenase E2 component (dihydrolipoamide acetyltransferase)